MLEATALVISILALLAAGLSVRYAHAQAMAASATHRLEAARRHDEITPSLKATIEPMDNGRWYRLALTLDGPRPLDQLDVEIVEGPGASFPSGQNGVAPMEAEPLLASFRGGARMQPGTSRHWRMAFSEESQGEDLLLRVQCVGSDDSGAQAVWDVVVPATNVPYDLSRSIL